LLPVQIQNDLQFIKEDINGWRDIELRRVERGTDIR